MEQTEPNDPDDPQGPQIPDDPNPPMTGYIAHTMTEGELMYYGHDSEYSKEGGAVYFLYLKDLNNSARGCSVCFYVNVPRQEKGSFTLPAGKYTASSTWEINTFNNKNTTRYRSNWNVVAPKWTQYVAEAGEFEVAIGDNMTYTIRGHMKGGSTSGAPLKRCNSLRNWAVAFFIEGEVTKRQRFSFPLLALVITTSNNCCKGS